MNIKKKLKNKKLIFKIFIPKKIKEKLLIT